MGAASHERENRTSGPLPYLGRPLPLHHTPEPAVAAAAQVPTAIANGLNRDAAGTLSPRPCRSAQRPVRGWQHTRGFRGLADSPRRPMLEKRRTSRTGVSISPVPHETHSARALSEVLVGMQTSLHPRTTRLSRNPNTNS